jgi:hypothetical protein
MAAARPTATPRVLADLERRGRVGALITQNVDGLHTRAGHRRVVDLHGRLDRVCCLACGGLAPREEVQRRLAALNPGYDDRPLATLPDGDVALEDTSDFAVATCDCGGALKPDENFEGVYRWLLERNMKMFAVAFALDALGDIYLDARLPLTLVSAEELDRLLGAVLTYADESFNPILELGFASSIRKEWEWRLSRGESTRNLEAFQALRPSGE